MCTCSGKHFHLMHELSHSQTPTEDGSHTTSHQSKSSDQTRESQGDDVKSQRSVSTKRSAASAASVKARAKVEAAKTMLSYAEMEADLIRQKAKAEAELHILQSKKAAAAALAEVAVYDEAEDQEEPNGVKPMLSEENPIIRTNNYLQHHFGENPIQLTNTHQSQWDQHEENQFKVPEVYQKPSDPPAAQELSRYLVRKELVASGLLKFDDNPGNYRAWKASFKNATKDLCLSPREELDLVTKWLGDKSVVQAKRIGNVHVQNPKAGLEMVWERLDESYGAPEVVERALLKKIEEFPKLNVREKERLRELGDHLLELQCAKDEGTLPGLAYLDTAHGGNPIAEKLPHNLQERWMVKGAQYKVEHKVSFPPFKFFAEFVRQQAKMRNDPSFNFTNSSTNPSNYTKGPDRPIKQANKMSVSTRKTEIRKDSPVNHTNPVIKKIENPDRQCPIHGTPHPLTSCRTFRNKHISERKSFLRETGICYRCCGSTQHFARDCKEPVQCTECNSDMHIAALHPGPPPTSNRKSTDMEDKGGEHPDSTKSFVKSNCTDICGDSIGGRSCSKICLVKLYPDRRPDEVITAYAVLDEQSNKSLAKPQLFDIFSLSAETTPYTLKTCSGTTETFGRRASNMVIESMDGKMKLNLPTLIECEEMPDDRTEIPSPEIAQHHSHLKSIVDKIPPIDEKSPILLGKDVLQLHKVREQINGPNDAPYAQRLDLGWVIIGEVCLGKSHKPHNPKVYKSTILQSGRPSLLKPCPSAILVKDVFANTENDETPAPSVEDKLFLEIMDREVYQDETNSWVAPLPFRTPRRRLPNNRKQAEKRLYIPYKKSLQRKPDEKAQFVDFIQKMLDNGHMERAPSLDNQKERWYLPMFGVHHPQKPDQIRVVFDSSAEFEGVSLNNMLLRGPDLNNSLLGVLMRFRKEPVAFIADIQQMFYCFMVREDHRDYLRLLWFEDNDMTKEITEYRMKVHVFGNRPSPSVAMYCMRRAAQQGEEKFGSDASLFVHRNFYVDDGLDSVVTPQDAIELLTRTRKMLAESNLNLHKIASNSNEVMNAFDVRDRAKGLANLDLSSDPLPLQRSLGVVWNLETDSFTFRVLSEVKNFSRRGVLSTINSLYDPLGFVAPVTLHGTVMMRELSSSNGDWDAPLDPDKEAEWTKWKRSLTVFENLSIPRCYAKAPLSLAQRKELFIFSDASTVAIGAVAYLRSIDKDGKYHVGFVMGKSKLAPKPAHTIPRLELCAAVLAVELSEVIINEMDIEVDAVMFFTDSKIVLGYVNNSVRMFYMYVANRVNRIRASSNPDQWHYITTENNPADLASRPTLAADLQNSSWFSGPAFLSDNTKLTNEENKFDLINPDDDKEIRIAVSTLHTNVTGAQMGSHRFERFSSWKRLCNAMARLIHVATSFKRIPGEPNKGSWQSCHKRKM